MIFKYLFVNLLIKLKLKMNIYLLTYLLLMTLALGFILANHGKKREDNYNFFTSLLSLAIQLFLLYKAGLFQN